MERSLRLVPIICYARNTRRFRDTRHPLSTPRLPACKVLDERLIRERNIPLSRNFPSLDNKDSRIFFRAFACARVRAIAQQNNSPTPVLGTAMISVFLRSAVFFFPKCKAGERAHGDVTRGAGAVFNCGVSFSSPGTSRYSARYSADQIALSPRYENTLCENSANLRAPREIALSSPRTSRSLDQPNVTAFASESRASRIGILSMVRSFHFYRLHFVCLLLPKTEYTHTHFILNTENVWESVTEASF